MGPSLHGPDHRLHAHVPRRCRRGDDDHHYELAVAADLARGGQGSAAAGAGGGADSDSDPDDDDGSGGLRGSDKGRSKEESDALESYVTGMLTNLGQLPLGRIHDMLKTYVAGSEISYDWAPGRLRSLLQRMCREERLECGPDGMYKLLRK